MKHFLSLMKRNEIEKKIKIIFYAETNICKMSPERKNESDNSLFRFKQ